jgi:hypothetical protein
MAAAVAELDGVVGLRRACALTGRSRASHYRAAAVVPRRRNEERVEVHRSRAMSGPTRAPRCRPWLRSGRSVAGDVPGAVGFDPEHLERINPASPVNRLADA